MASVKFLNCPQQ